MRWPFGGFVTWLLMIAVIATVSVVLLRPAIDRALVRSDTERKLSTWCSKLSADKVQSGEYRRYAGEIVCAEKDEKTDNVLMILPEQDSWGGPVYALYTRDEKYEYVKIISAGPDGELDTDDDLAKTAKTGRMKAIKEGMSIAKEKGKAWAAGASDRLKAAFKRKKPEEPKKEPAKQ